MIVVGTGLLGASVGLAARNSMPVQEIVGVDPRAASLETALRRGAVDTAAPKLDAELLRRTVEHAETTLVVFCAPVSVLPVLVADTVKQLADIDLSDRTVLLTDTGSTKHQLTRSIADSRFIGSHPIAGSEKSGPEHARADLFRNRLTVLTPTPRNAETDIERLRKFWESLGSEVVRMDAAEHDVIFAATSHLPHAVAVALASFLRDEERRFTGSGYAGMVRLAASSPELWADILLDNGDSVLNALDRFERKLRELADALRAKDTTGVLALLREAEKKAR